MGYEEERDRSGHRRSRRAKPSEMEDDGLTLITDSFTERPGGRIPPERR